MKIVLVQIFVREVKVYLGVLGQKKPAVSGISISTSSYPQLEQVKANDKSAKVYLPEGIDDEQYFLDCSLVEFKTLIQDWNP